jgi:hypothetical protein
MRITVAYARWFALDAGESCVLAFSGDLMICMVGYFHGVIA